MFRRKSDNDKLKALIESIRKEAFDAGFSYGWDAALTAVMDRVSKREAKTEESKLEWEAMTNGNATGHYGEV